MKRIITEKLLDMYREYLYEEEKSTATIKKYICDLNKLKRYADGRELTKTLVINYKEYLQKCEHYKASSINSFLTAANGFFRFMEWYELHVKTIRIQKNVFLPKKKDLSKAEYKKLVRAAVKTGKYRLAMIIQTVCSTGIRISELADISVESVRQGTVEVSCKGKKRVILLPSRLQKMLMKYIDKNGIKSGPVFCTSKGKPVDRSNIWKEMKNLCEKARVGKEKIFPHNLRHLFAKTFYSVEKDISKLADVLGHSSIETTRLYIMTSSDKHRKILNKMDLVVALE